MKLVRNDSKPIRPPVDDITKSGRVAERPRSKPETYNRQELSSAFPNRIERFDQNFIARLRSEHRRPSEGNAQIFE
jgi:hypothetical protein